MTKIQKGTPVIMVRPWDNGRGDSATFTVSTRRLTIESLGKKQGTATAADYNGRFIKEQISPSQIGVTIIAEADATEAALFAAAKKWQDDEISRVERIISNEAFASSDPFYQKAVRETLAEVKKPILIKDYYQLCKSL